MGRWEELDQKRAVQSGTGPGEFGPDYSDRKTYQLGYGNESPSPILKELLVNTHRNPREGSRPTGRDPLDPRKNSPYPSHVMEPFVTSEDIEREEFEKDINYNIWKGLV